MDRPEFHRKQKLWPTLLSGGQIEFLLDDLLGTDSFKTPERQALRKSVAIARTFMEDHLPFWEMAPADDLVDGDATIKVGLGSGRSFQLGAQVFQKPNEVYAIYFPTATRTGRLDLRAADGNYQARWFNPRTGDFEGPVSVQAAGGWIEPGAPPSDRDNDWVLLLNRPTGNSK